MPRRMRLHTDEEFAVLYIGEKAFGLGHEANTFEVNATALKGVSLSDIPLGTRIQICDPVVGSAELTPRSPFAVFEKTLSLRNGKAEPAEAYLACCEIPVLWPHDTQPEPEELQEWLDRESLRMLRQLQEVSEKVGLRSATRECYREIAYVVAELSLPDQLVLDAEAFVEQLQQALLEGLSGRLLFVCHASEDGPFVDALIEALDRRALHAWYDKREIIVGDSIVDKINEGLSEARYLVVVLSPRSVKKPWVKRELNATLMRQLSSAEIGVLPVLLEDCKIPPLLTDIKYADFRTSFDLGLSELLSALRGAGR